MELKILLFGVTRDIIGPSPYRLVLKGKTVRDLKDQLNNSFPKLQGLNSLFIAINNEYTEEDQQINSTDEIALIPPVSGG